MFLVLVELIGLELLSGRNFVLDSLFVIGPSAVWTGALLVCCLERVEAKLTYLRRVSQSVLRIIHKTHLVAARTWSEVLVGEIELLNAERAAELVSFAPEREVRD